MIAVPVSWFPKLYRAKPKERQEWRLNEASDGMVWERLGCRSQARSCLRRAETLQPPARLGALGLPFSEARLKTRVLLVIQGLAIPSYLHITEHL
ncbi:MAG: hypothetical protein ACREYE_27860 [Gammaproteobacteria bacterium]